MRLTKAVVERRRAPRTRPSPLHWDGALKESAFPGPRARRQDVRAACAGVEISGPMLPFERLDWPQSLAM